MAALDVVRQRLRSQRLVGTRFERPADVVKWMGAVQAQDYLGSLWGVGLRTTRATEADVERAIEERSIVRTWPMRGTLHFVAAEDVRWMLRLLAPRIISRAAGRHRQLGLDAATFEKSRSRLEKVLAGGRVLSRPELYRVLERAGVATAEQRGLHIVAQLAMKGILCFGARSGRQPTFALLDEWLPAAPVLDRDDALGELAARYFTSHGPATVQDLAWWSGLPLGDARRGLAVAGKRLAEREGTWAAVAHLLPAFDEYTVAYRDRSAFLDPSHAVRARNGIFSAVVTVDGRIVGTWRRRMAGHGVVVHGDLFDGASHAVSLALERALKRYRDFLGLPVSSGERLP